MSVRGFYVYVLYICMTVSYSSTRIGACYFVPEEVIVFRRASIYLLLAKDGDSYPPEDDEDAPLEAALRDVEVHF